jgi:hypothetical protein
MKARAKYEIQNTKYEKKDENYKLQTTNYNELQIPNSKTLILLIELRSNPDHPDR